MVSSVLIIIVSLALFLYWLRYSCLLLLRNRTGDELASQMADANWLNFPQVQASLQKPTSLELDTLQKALDRDYRILTYLSQHAAGLAPAFLEQTLLPLDYHVMRFRYRLTRKLLPQQARKALQEMSGIVVYLASSMGQRLVSASES